MPESLDSFVHKWTILGSFYFGMVLLFWVLVRWDDKRLDRKKWKKSKHQGEINLEVCKSCWKGRSKYISHSNWVRYAEAVERNKEVFREGKSVWQ